MTSCLVLAENIVEVNIYFNIDLEEDIVGTDKAEFLLRSVSENIYFQVFAKCIDQVGVFKVVYCADWFGSIQR